MMKKKTVKPDRICFECLHYEACQSWNIGSLARTAADNCVNYRASVDVRPVVRGTWVGIDDFPHDDWECDHCGCVVENTDDPWNYFHFCPNCGADMREKGE